MLEGACLAVTCIVQVTSSSMQLLKLFPPFNAEATSYSKPETSPITVDSLSLQTLAPTWNPLEYFDSSPPFLGRLSSSGPWTVTSPQSYCNSLDPSLVLGHPQTTFFILEFMNCHLAQIIDAYAIGIGWSESKTRDDNGETGQIWWQN